MQDVFDLRPPPAVDGLVVVAHHKEVPVHAREHLDDVELHGVGILKFVDVDIAELARKIFPRLLVGSKQRARLGEKVVKVERVVLLQVRIVLFVDLHRLFDVALRAVLRGVLRGRKPQHLGVGDMPLDALQEAVLFEVQLLEGLFDDGGALLLGIDGKVLREPPALGIHPQDAHTHGVDGAHPHPPRIGDGGKALFHLVRRLVGEGDGKDILGRYPHIPHEVGDARRQNARLAAARPREHQNGPLRRLDGQPLFFVQVQNVHGGYYIISAAFRQAIGRSSHAAAPTASAAAKRERPRPLLGGKPTRFRPGSALRFCLLSSFELLLPLKAL